MEKTFRDQIKALCPLVDNIRLMISAARHAFNRHSQAQLEAMVRLHKAFTLEIDPFFERVEAGEKKGAAAEQPDWVKLRKVLTHLELMADRIASLADHLRYKANHGVILAEQSLIVVNNLFSDLTGLMQTLVDIFELNDPSLKAYVLQECRKLTDAWFREQVAHETRMMDGFGQPDAWSVYLAILERGREVAGHLTDIIKSLD